MGVGMGMGMSTGWGNVALNETGKSHGTFQWLYDCAGIMYVVYHITWYRGQLQRGANSHLCNN
jgi:hypothetical protein